MVTVLLSRVECIHQFGHPGQDNTRCSEAGRQPGMRQVRILGRPFVQVNAGKFVISVPFHFAFSDDRRIRGCVFDVEKVAQNNLQVTNRINFVDVCMPDYFCPRMEPGNA